MYVSVSIIQMLIKYTMCGFIMKHFFSFPFWCSHIFRGGLLGFWLLMTIYMHKYITCCIINCIYKTSWDTKWNKKLLINCLILRFHFYFTISFSGFLYHVYKCLKTHGSWNVDLVMICRQKMWKRFCSNFLT